MLVGVALPVVSELPGFDAFMSLNKFELLERVVGFAPPKRPLVVVEPPNKPPDVAGCCADSAGFAKFEKRPPPDCWALDANRFLGGSVGGGPAGVVELPRSKVILFVAGVVEPRGVAVVAVLLLNTLPKGLVPGFEPIPPNKPPGGGAAAVLSPEPLPPTEVEVPGAVSSFFCPKLNGSEPLPPKDTVGGLTVLKRLPV